MNQRLQQLQQWLQQGMNLSGDIRPLCGDASFRRYFRLHTPQQSYIIMDAPPDKENCNAFLAIAQQFKQANIHVPEILAHDLPQGFLLLSDFGDQLLWHSLTQKPHSANELYQNAFTVLLTLQASVRQEAYQWPHFTAQELQRELELFSNWYLQEFRQLKLTAGQYDTLQATYDQLIYTALSQPQVCVHRDYHSRNIMIINEHQELGILDFQDALWGPVTYDLVSLLRDCYLDWAPQLVIHWVLTYYQLALNQGMINLDSPQEFIRWFDYMGLQRHIKCVGIFARLAKRDNKPNYLQYLPRILNYIRTVSKQYAEFNSFTKLLDHLT